MKKIQPITRQTIKNLKAFASAHKVVAGLIVLALFSAVIGTVKAARAVTGTRYILGTVERGTITSSVSGSGTVSASNQIDLKAKASGDITVVNVKTGEHVSAGTLIASIDATDAAISLRSAQISLEKLQESADASTLIQARQSLSDAQTSETKAYADAFAESASVFLDLPTVIDGMNTMLYTNSGYLSDPSVTQLGTTASSYRMSAGREFDTAKREYDYLSLQYKGLNTQTATSTLIEFYDKTITTLTDLLTALKDTSVAVGYVKNISANSPDANSARIAQMQGDTAQASLSGWTNTVATHLNTLTNLRTTIRSAPSTVAARQASLDKLVEGADPLDIESQQLALRQRQEAYNDYFIRATFDGTVGKINVKQGDSVSSGTTVATIITPEKIAEISLNEVDAAKVKVGDKATLTFDAIDNLSIVGTVSDLDLIGTVTQGVVNYNAKITFDTDDPRVLSGMSVNADIITDAKSDVLSVPSSAVKTDAQGSYVLVFQPPLPPSDTNNAQGIVTKAVPVEVPVETGMTSDTAVEITSGLTEGEQIVVRSAAAAAATAQSAPTFFGGGVRAGGATRSLGR